MNVLRAPLSASVSCVMMQSSLRRNPGARERSLLTHMLVQRLGADQRVKVIVIIHKKRFLFLHPNPVYPSTVHTLGYTSELDTLLAELTSAKEERDTLLTQLTTTIGERYALLLSLLL